MRKFGILTLTALLFCTACSQKTTTDVVDAVDEDVSHDFNELGEETEKSVEDDGQDAKESETLTGDFEDLE